MTEASSKIQNNTSVNFCGVRGSSQRRHFTYFTYRIFFNYVSAFHEAYCSRKQTYESKRPSGGRTVVSHNGSNTSRPSPPTQIYLWISCYCIPAAKTWLATCKPYRGIFKRVCGQPSNCDTVWLLTVASSTVAAPGKPELHGPTSALCLWLLSVCLISSSAPASMFLPPSLSLA